MSPVHNFSKAAKEQQSPPRHSQGLEYWVGVFKVCHQHDCNTLQKPCSSLPCLPACLTRKPGNWMCPSQCTCQDTGGNGILIPKRKDTSLPEVRRHGAHVTLLVRRVTLWHNKKHIFQTKHEICVLIHLFFLFWWVEKGREKES